MANRPTIRGFSDLHDVYNLRDTWDLYPIHASGMAVFMKNENAVAVTISVQDSPDGVTYSPVLFSTPAVGGQVNLTLQPLANAVILFMSRQQFVRIRSTPRGEDGVFTWTVQYPPVGQLMQGEEAYP